MKARLSVIIFFLTLFAGGQQQPLRLYQTGLRVSIATTDHQQRMVNIDQRGTQLFVVIENKNTPLSIWGENCSWGYENIAFEMVVEGKRTDTKYSVKKLGQDWDKNFPIAINLNPNERLLRAIDFASGLWTGLPVIKPGSSLTVKARAIFNNEPDWASQEKQVWTGRAVSDWAYLTLIRSQEAKK